MGPTSNNNTKITVCGIVDDNYETELVARITDSHVYKKLCKKLPIPRIIAYLYIKDNMKCLMNDQNDGLFYIAEIELNSYIEQLYNRAIVDCNTIKLFVTNFSKIMNSQQQDGRLNFSKSDTDNLLTALEHTYKYYWECKTSGALYPALAVIQVFSNMKIYMVEVDADNMVKQFLEIYSADAERKKRFNNGQPIKKISIEKASDLTIIIDYSFDNNKHNASYRLTSLKDRIPIKGNLLDGNLTKFLREYVIDPLTLYENKISPGMTTDIDNWDTYQRNYPTKYHINNINNQIRKFVDSNTKLRFFVRRKHTITVKCHIIVSSESKKDRFGH